MLLKYFLVIIINVKLSLSYYVLPDTCKVPRQIPLLDTGKPLILTPYLESNQIEEALKLSKVESFLKDEDVYSNSGFFTVNKEHSSNLFFWFFQQWSDDWEEVPLLLWLQGGPGMSSMYGVFEENGPYIVTEKGLKKRSDSWISNYNVLYIDQPVGAGFSFTKPSGYISTQEEVADHLYEALTQFFQLFPQLKKNAFYITGESYAGKYIPAISYKIHKSMENGLTDINLKGLFMISPTTEGLFNGWTSFLLSIKIIRDKNIESELEKLEKGIESAIRREEWHEASKLRCKLLNKVENESKVSLYNYKDKERPMDEPYISFLRQPDIKEKCHVGNEFFEKVSTRVFKDFFDDISKSVVPIVEELVEHYPVAFVSGELDLIVAHPLVLIVTEKLDWKGQSKYLYAHEKEIYVNDSLMGFIKSADNLKYIRILNAGHNVPKDQPEVTLYLLDKFVNGTL